MTAIITAQFQSADAASNALEDLAATGIPGDQIHLNKEETELKIVAPESAEREITEILQRHQPLRLAS